MEMVKILEGAKKGQDIRNIGSDIALGQIVISKGSRLGPSEIGILASCGISTIKVYDCPK
jgi:gephyrin